MIRAKKDRARWRALSREEASALYASGEWDYDRFAREYGVARITVQVQFQQWGIYARPEHRPEHYRWQDTWEWRKASAAELACLYYERGLTQREIGARYGVGADVVSRRFRKLGILVDRERRRKRGWD